MTSPYQGAVDQLKRKLPVASIYGQDFTLHGALTTLDISEFARASTLETDSAESQAFLAETFRAAFGDHTQEGRAEYGRFRRHLRDLVMSGRKEDEVLLGALRAAVEAHATFPTTRPSDSPAPRSATTDGSRDSGSQPAAPDTSALGEWAEVAEQAKTWPPPLSGVPTMLVEGDDLPTPPAPTQDAVVYNLGRRAS